MTVRSASVTTASQILEWRSCRAPACQPLPKDLLPPAVPRPCERPYKKQEHCIADKFAIADHASSPDVSERLERRRAAAHAKGKVFALRECAPDRPAKTTCAIHVPSESRPPVKTAPDGMSARIALSQAPAASSALKVGRTTEMCSPSWPPCRASRSAMPVSIDAS